MFHRRRIKIAEILISQDYISEKQLIRALVEEKKSGDFIGCIGLHEPSSDLPFSPCVEIAWRLLHKYWGEGYATEAAKKALDYAFEELNLDEVVSFTAHINHRSEAVMKRLSMKKSPSLAHSVSSVSIL